MLLLLARHGNTFNKGDKVVWVGARTDLPLTVKGREQAQALGEALAPFAPRIKRVVAGPLLRTREQAAIICEALKTPSPCPSPQEERGRSNWPQPDSLSHPHPLADAAERAGVRGD